MSSAVVTVARRAFGLALLLLLPLQVRAAPPNPPPANALQGYAAYELKAVTIAPEIADKKNADKVLATVQEHVERTLAPIVRGWNATATAADAVPVHADTLVIEPRITTLHKPSGATRFFAGAFAGDGRIVMKVRISEAHGGALIAEPEFYRRANAMAGAWTVGAHDNAMLGKVVGLIADYLNGNYAKPVGGETGYEP